MTVPSPTLPAMTDAAGWYPDPDGSPAVRYWDGQVWTEHVAAAQPAKRCANPTCGDQAQPGREYCAVHPFAAPVQKIVKPARGASQLLCPHCQVRGQVTSKQVKRKKGVSGGKATGAVLTGGVSLLATGLSRKESVTEMRCANCSTVWNV